MGLPATSGARYPAVLIAGGLALVLSRVPGTKGALLGGTVATIMGIALLKPGITVELPGLEMKLRSDLIIQPGVHLAEFGWSSAFQTGSATYTGDCARLVVDLEAWRGKRELLQVVLVGHADRRSHQKSNCQLARNRADSVGRCLKDGGYSGPVLPMAAGPINLGTVDSKQLEEDRQVLIVGLLREQHRWVRRIPLSWRLDT